MQLATVTIKPPGDFPRPRCREGKRPGRAAAFTLIEVLAAMLFMAIVIPAAMEALHVASMSGEVAVRKAAAMRIADAVLIQNIATTNWNQYSSGTILQNGHEYRWSLNDGFWPAGATMELLTAEVGFSVQGRNYTVHLNTLELPLSMTATNNVQ